MDPFTIAMLISAALSAYSSVQQGRAVRKTEDAQAAAAMAERQRQAALDDERAAAVAASQKDFEPEKQVEERDTIAKNLETYLKPGNERTTAEAEFADRANPGAPKEINESRERALSGAVSKGADYAKNLARMSALKNLNFDNALSINRLGQNVGELNTQSARSASLLPGELEAAKGAGNASNTRASAAQGLASIAAMYGAAYKPAAAVPGTVAQPAGVGLKAVDQFGVPLSAANTGYNPYRISLVGP